MKIPEPAAPAPEPGFPNIVVNSGVPGAGSAGSPAGEAGRSSTSQAAATSARSSKKSWFSTGGGDSVSSDVSLVASGIVGAVATVVWLIAVIPLRNYQLGQLFLA